MNEISEALTTEQKIITVLALEQEVSNRDLAKMLKVSNSTIHFHTRILKSQNLIIDRRGVKSDYKFKYWRIADNNIAKELSKALVKFNKDLIKIKGMFDDGKKTKTKRGRN